MLIPRASMKYKRLSSRGNDASDQAAQLYSMAILVERLRPCAEHDTSFHQDLPEPTGPLNAGRASLGLHVTPDLVRQVDLGPQRL